MLEPAADFAKGVVTVPAVHSLAAHPPLRAMMRRELDDSHHKLLCSGVPATLATVDSLIDEAAAVRPDLAEPARRYRDSRLALVLPRYRSLLSS